MSTFTLDSADLTPEITVALAKAGLLDVTSAPAPQAPAKASGWINVRGFSCANDFLAWTSSNGIVRHLSGKCNCRKGGDNTCRSFTKGHVTMAEFKTQPGATLVKNEAKQVFTIG